MFSPRKKVCAVCVEAFSSIFILKDAPKVSTFPGFHFSSAKRYSVFGYRSRDKNRFGRGFEGLWNNKRNERLQTRSCHAQRHRESKEIKWMEGTKKHSSDTFHVNIHLRISTRGLKPKVALYSAQLLNFWIKTQKKTHPWNTPIIILQSCNQFNVSDWNQIVTKNVSQNGNWTNFAMHSVSNLDCTLLLGHKELSVK